nr:immunoglobulin light chain junction region [Macaca mulatta]MOV61402.1 immunoglobulin light chain junction region [Macaca mulatta]MOV62303.1 immunoglobulin light chain junction region [Macaca mulatta]MOV62333.1 immunoglobulin light chain junction region [Macaca mulatta]MOV62354.1 immunoglobulin light chain junction region [Macaca mulatta]
CQKYISSPFTF